MNNKQKKLLIILCTGFVIVGVLASVFLRKNNSQAESENVNQSTVQNTTVQQAADNGSEDKEAQAADTEKPEQANNETLSENELANDGVQTNSGSNSKEMNIDKVVKSVENEKTEITLKNDNADITGEGAVFSEGILTISKAGTYVITGKFENGQIMVEAGKDDNVVLVLDNAELSNLSTAAIYVANADNTVLVLADGSSNIITSGAKTEITDTSETDSEAAGAAIYSKDDLGITGNGSLEVGGYINNGIHSSNDLTINGGNIKVTAVNNAVKGKDSVNVNGGTIEIISGNDGIKSDNDTEEGLGNVYLNAGNITIRSYGDGVQAQNNLVVNDGVIDIYTGEGSESAAKTNNSGFGGFGGFGGPSKGTGWDMSDDTTVSSKGLKAGSYIEINGGIINADTFDDAIHSNGTIVINAGELKSSAGDDGIHADDALTINNGKIDIAMSYEGLEANQIVIEDGDISVSASDDGVNASGGSTSNGFFGMGYGNNTSQTANDELPQFIVRGGTLYVNAAGDGLDSNGNLIIEGGLIMVDGPVDSGNGALDSGSESGGVITISGGTIIAVGSSGMAETFSSASTQNSFLYNLDTAFAAGTEIKIYNSDNKEIFSFTTAKTGNSIVFSSEELKVGENYTLKVGDSSQTFTLDSVSTSIGNSQGMGGFGGRGQGGSNNGFGSQRGEWQNGQPNGDMPQRQKGDRQMPDGESSGEMPQMPDGEHPEGMPQMPDGEQPEGMPQMPNGEKPEGV